MRGPLALPPVPIARTRREEFEDLVLDAVERVDAHLARSRELTLEGVVFAVDDVPALEPEVEEDEVPEVPLGHVEPATARSRTVVVVHRRPLEARADDDEQLADAVLDTVVELVADLLGLDPDDVDPDGPVEV
jgi:predicted Zn-dependent protease with MMP-like domain